MLIEVCLNIIVIFKYLLLLSIATNLPSNISYPFENVISFPSILDASSSRVVEEVSEATLELKEDEAICTANLDKNSETINDDGGETINDDEGQEINDDGVKCHI